MKFNRSVVFIILATLVCTSSANASAGIEDKNLDDPCTFFAGKTYGNIFLLARQTTKEHGPYDYHAFGLISSSLQHGSGSSFSICDSNYEFMCEQLGIISAANVNVESLALTEQGEEAVENKSSLELFKEELDIAKSIFKRKLDAGRLKHKPTTLQDVMREWHG